MNSDLRSMKLNLADPESIAGQLPELEEVVMQKRRAAEETERDYKSWRGLVGKLRSIAGIAESFEEEGEITPAALDAVVKAVEEEDRRIMAIGVAEWLDNEGHYVDGPAAVQRFLLAAAEAGRIRRVGMRAFAPLTLQEESTPRRAVPEAHLGMSGPEPQSKAEGVLRILGTDVEREWSPQEVSDVMARSGWVSDASVELPSVTSTLSRLYAEDKVFRPQRGRYRLAPASGGSG